jgi:hypothetical protein
VASIGVFAAAAGLPAGSAAPSARPSPPHGRGHPGRPHHRPIDPLQPGLPADRPPPRLPGLGVERGAGSGDPPHPPGSSPERGRVLRGNPDPPQHRLLPQGLAGDPGWIQSAGPSGQLRPGQPRAPAGAAVDGADPLPAARAVSPGPPDADRHGPLRPVRGHPAARRDLGGSDLPAGAPPLADRPSGWALAKQRGRPAPHPPR